MVIILSDATVDAFVQILNIVVGDLIFTIAPPKPAKRASWFLWYWFPISISGHLLIKQFISAIAYWGRVASATDLRNTGVLESLSPTHVTYVVSLWKKNIVDLHPVVGLKQLLLRQSITSWKRDGTGTWGKWHQKLSGGERRELEKRDSQGGGNRKKLGKFSQHREILTKEGAGTGSKMCEVQIPHAPSPHQMEKERRYYSRLETL